MATRYNYTGGIVTNGLVLNLDAAKTDSYPGTGTTWRDLSGFNNNGTLTNGPTFSGIGKQASIVFDGVDDYISSLATTSTLGLTSSNGGTIVSWMNITLLSRWTGTANFTAGRNLSDFGWDIEPGNTARLWKNDLALSTGISLSSYNGIWTMYTIASDSTNIKLYINSTLSYTTNTTGSLQSRTGGILTLMDHWDNSVQGRLSTTQIYNRALTAQEVQQNFNALRGRYGI
jgi:hypothetical protein